MIQVVCICKRRFEVQDSHAGLAIKCPGCRRLVEVPVAGAVTESSAPGPIVEAEAEAEAGTLNAGIEAHPTPGTAPTAGTGNGVDLDALRVSIERLADVGRSLQTRLAWIAALLALILVRLLML